MLVARKSGIVGRGLFTTANIRMYQWVCEYTGRRYAPGAPLPETVNDFTYLWELSDGTVIDGGDPELSNDSRHLNAACDPNCDMVEWHGRVFLFSNRRIRRGQELTIGYKITGDKPIHRCYCGSPKCKRRF